MRYRLLGQTGLRVSELFLGAMAFGEQDGSGAPPQECRRMLDLYADAGGNVVDTAINYRGGESERILGELLEGRRDRFVLATKYTVSRDGSDLNAAGNHRKNLVRSLEDPLRRDLRRPGVGRQPCQHPCRMAWLDAVRGPAGAVQPAAARHRAGAAADGGGAR